MEMIWTYIKKNLSDYIQEQRFFKASIGEWLFDMLTLPIGLIFQILDYVSWDGLHLLPKKIEEAYRHAD